MRFASWVLLAVLSLSGLGVARSAANAQETTIKVGMARSTSNSAELMAINKGYFKEFGIKLEIEDIESSANVIALLAQGRLNMVAGGISAGYFNAIEKNLPITIVADRVSTPIRHNLMIRPDLKDQIKSFRDLKGKVIASNATGSVSTYEIGKMLEREGLTIADVEIKVVPFPQMAVAFANKAIDGAIVIPPFVWAFEDQKIAVKFGEADDLIDPRPMSIAVIMVNTDWAKQNKQVLSNYILAWMRGVRDYCQAFHGSALRADVVDALVKSGTERRPELLHKYPWPARSPNGQINVASMLDIQSWYLKSKMISAQFPAERLTDMSYVQNAAQKLGPFVVENKDSKHPGCR
jgi:NitT/TauT family transport system substrate-binding protein